MSLVFYLAGIDLIVQLQYKQDTLVDKLQRQWRFRRIAAQRLRLPATSTVLQFAQPRKEKNKRNQVSGFSLRELYLIGSHFVVG